MGSAELAAATRPQGSQADGTCLLCRVQRTLCALPLSAVIETMRPLPIDTLSGAPPFVAGVSVIRGEPVAVVDIAQLVGASRATPRRFVTVRSGNRTLALAVEEVIGVRSLQVASLVQLPPLLREAGGEAIEAIGTLDEELLLLLGATRIVPEELLRSLETEARRA